MENFNGTAGKLSVATDSRPEGKHNRYLILADGRKMVGAIFRKNSHDFKDKANEVGFMHPDPEAEANTRLLLASKDLLQELEKSTAQMNVLHDQTFGPLGMLLAKQIRKNESLILKIYGNG
jgi:hypothetical protein